MLFSYIIPTIGRSSLHTAVQSVLDQTFSQADYEIIVVNDSGKPLEKAAWHELEQVRILDTNQAERSFARNSGAAVARGKYLAFLDDDDWVLPGALESFWHLAQQYPLAAWLYGGIRIVDERGRALGEINSRLEGNAFAQMMGGAWAPLQASLIQSQAFFAIGGFNPLICGTEDEDLCRRISAMGDLAHTENVVACLFRGQSWNTSTNYLRAPEDTRYSRNLILSEPGVFKRLKNSTKTAYWAGRVLKVYLSTVVWNFKRNAFIAALSRLLHSLSFALVFAKYTFSRLYWDGLTADHVPDTLHFVMKEHNADVE